MEEALKSGSKKRIRWNRISLFRTKSSTRDEELHFADGGYIIQIQIVFTTYTTNTFSKTFFLPWLEI